MNTFDLTAFFGQFREETAENVRSISDGLLVLEAHPADRGALDGVFRAAHTIKGSARMLGQTETANLAHALETVLGNLRSGQLVMSAALNDALLAGTDVLLALGNRVDEPAPTDERTSAIIAQLTDFGLADVVNAAPVRQPMNTSVSSNPIPQTPKAQPAPAMPQPSAPISRASVVRPTVRIPIKRLDRLLNTTGELVVARQAHLAHSDTLTELSKLVFKQQRTIQTLLATTLKLRGAASVRDQIAQAGEQLAGYTRQLDTMVRNANEQWTMQIASTDALVDELEAEVMATRLQPIAGLFAPLPRAVRELARSLDKDVTLLTEGESTEADRKIIEVLSEPLLHLVRNCLDHGIESAAERASAGKPPAGTLRLSARSAGATIEISISDDGRGIDPTVLRQTALRKGLLDAEAAQRLADDEALELIWQPGFSTTTMITDVSGRGVGLDVVRTAVVDIGGSIAIESVVGQGTTFTLTLPLTVLTTRILLFEASGGVYALPSTACMGGRRVQGGDFQMIEGRPTVRVNGRLVAVVALAPLLEQRGPLPQPSNISTLLLLGPANRPLALLVDRLLDEREAVVKSLGPLLANQRLCSGGVIMPNGSLVLLLNAAALTDRARAIGRPTTVAAPPLRPARLLVAEDSFTTRELLRSILQSAGYTVETAIHGRDALDKLQTNTYDLVVSDVEMPHVNGFELTRRIRADQHRRDMPIIIITSLAREADRREGLLAGAQAYIVKSQFDQSNLLETIQQLLGR